LIEHGHLTAFDVEEVAGHFTEELFGETTLATPTSHSVPGHVLGDV
jgi:hypothetical protein